jgi:multicomponent Na+:H+ antiporter subunit G
MNEMFKIIIESVVALLILLGAILALLSAWGLIRLPDVYTRSHAATKSATLGVMSILLGTFIFFWVEMGELSWRLLLGIAFVFVTAPVAGHLIGRAAYRSGVPLWGRSVRDDLRQVLQPKRRGEDGEI